MRIPEHVSRHNDPHPQGVSCRGCSHFILEGTDEVAYRIFGWAWCRECFYSLPEVQEQLAREAAADVRRDER